MSRPRGNVLQNVLARYLSRWWPNAESAGSGRNGRDILGTPGVWWENKTSGPAKGKRCPECGRRDESGGRLRPGEFVRQAVDSADFGELPVVVWWPPGVGAKNPGKAIAMLSLPWLMALLEICELAPPPAPTPMPAASPTPPPPLPFPPAPTPTDASSAPLTPPQPSSTTPPPAFRLIKGDLS